MRIDESWEVFSLREEYRMVRKKRENCKQNHESHKPDSN